MTRRPLSPTMADALLAFRASDEEFGEPPFGAREGTRIALETRGLIESKPDPRARVRWWQPLVYRRTIDGDNVAIELSLAREVQP